MGHATAAGGGKTSHRGGYEAVSIYTSEKYEG